MKRKAIEKKDVPCIIAPAAVNGILTELKQEKPISAS